MDQLTGLKILAPIICCLQEMHFIGNGADWGPNDGRPSVKQRNASNKLA